MHDVQTFLQQAWTEAEREQAKVEAERDQLRKAQEFDTQLRTLRRALAISSPLLCFFVAFLIHRSGGPEWIYGVAVLVCIPCGILCIATLDNIFSPE